MNAKGIFTIRKIAELVKQGEGSALEFKRSTGELKEAMKTLCAFLNGTGGTVLVGVWPSGKIEGQEVSDQTLRDIAQAFDKFEPPVNLPVERLSVGGNRDLLILRVDRIEIQSYGGLPSVVRLDQLSGPHLSKLRNPLIAGAFHRTGAVECWGRGTNRVIAMCEKHGALPPSFEEREGFLIVTFNAQIVVGAGTAVPGDEKRPESRSAREVTAQVTGQVESIRNVLSDNVLGELSDSFSAATGQVTGQVAAQVMNACQTPQKASEIQSLLGIKHRETFLNNYLKPLLVSGWIERTIPDKPNSRLQKYRLTAKGKATLEKSA